MELRARKVLVTGGAGFIGSHLTGRLLELGASVTVYDNFDRFYRGKEANLASIAGHPSFSLVEGDILDGGLLRPTMAGTDVVFHLAGQAGVGFSVDDPTSTNRTNVDGTLSVLNVAREAGVRRVVNASSSSVFGIPEYLPLDEAHPTNPNSPYGVSKLTAEMYGKVFAKVYGMEVVSLRYFSVYGPRGRPDQVIHRFTKSLSEGNPPVINGDGSQTRDFTHVSDVVAATIAAGEKDGVGGEVFNIGFGARTSIQDLAEKLIALMGLKGKLSPVNAQGSKGDFPHTQADNRKASDRLGWRPKMSLDAGLKDYVDWFVSSRRLVGA